MLDEAKRLDRSVPASLATVTELLLAQAGSPRPGLRFENTRWSWQEHVSECARYAAALRARRRPGRPFHVGVLADNVPEFSFLLGGCALAGAVLVALNPVRRGDALAADAARTDCQYVLAEPRYAALLPAMDIPVLSLDGLELPAHAPLDAPRSPPASPDDTLMLIFTSGTSGEPKAVRCTHGKIAVPGRMLAGRFGLTTADTVYVSMPMFHSNAILAGWAVGLAAGRRSRCAASSRRPRSCPMCGPSARPTPTTSASRSATCLPRLPALTTPTTRCGSPTATRARPATSPGSPSVSAAR